MSRARALVRDAAQRRRQHEARTDTEWQESSRRRARGRRRRPRQVKLKYTIEARVPPAAELALEHGVLHDLAVDADVERDLHDGRGQPVEDDGRPKILSLRTFDVRGTLAHALHARAPSRRRVRHLGFAIAEVDSVDRVLVRQLLVAELRLGRRADERSARRTTPSDAIAPRTSPSRSPVLLAASCARTTSMRSWIASRCLPSSTSVVCSLPTTMRSHVPSSSSVTRLHRLAKRRRDVPRRSRSRGRRAARRGTCRSPAP